MSNSANLVKVECLHLILLVFANNAKEYFNLQPHLPQKQEYRHHLLLCLVIYVQYSLAALNYIIVDSVLRENKRRIPSRILTEFPFETTGADEEAATPQEGNSGLKLLINI